MKGDKCGATIKNHLVVVMRKKNLLSHTESVWVSSFPLNLKLGHFNTPPSKDPHNKGPLIDYNRSTRAANGLSLPVCPLFICVQSIRLSLYDGLFTVAMLLCACENVPHTQQRPGVSVYWWESEHLSPSLSCLLSFCHPWALRFVLHSLTWVSLQ